MQLLGGKQTDPERLRIPCFPRRPLSTSGFIFFKWQDFAVENTSYTRHTGLLSAPAREAYLLTVRHPDGSGRNYTTHTRKVRSRLLAATKLFDRVRDPRIPLVKGAPGVHRRPEPEERLPFPICDVSQWSDQKPSSHCDVAVPRERDELHVPRRDRVAEALPHLGVPYASVAREREGPRFVRHWNPRAGQVHLDLVGRNPWRRRG